MPSGTTLLKYSFLADADVRFDGKAQLSARDHSNVVFHNHVKEAPNASTDANRINIEPQFWNPTPAP